MASTTTNPFPLATETGTTDNSAGSVNAGGSVDNAAGASGGSSSGAQISPSAMIAIIVVVSIVAVLGGESPVHQQIRISHRAYTDSIYP